MGKRRIFITAILLIGLFSKNVFADDLDDLMDLSEAPASAGGGSDVEETADSSDSAGGSMLSVSIGGYLKALGYWNQERYSDTFWQNMYLNLPARPEVVLPRCQREASGNIVFIYPMSKRENNYIWTRKLALTYESNVRTNTL